MMRNALAATLALSCATGGSGLSAQGGGRIGPALIGRGYDPLQSAVLAPCVADSGLTNVALDPETARRVGFVTYQLDDVTSREQLRRALQVSAAASVGIGPFSASAEARLLQSTEFSRYNRYFTVRAAIEMVPREIATPTFTPTAAAALERGANEFFFSCGSEFVSGSITGALMHGVVEVRAETEAEAKAVDASAKVGYAGVFSAQAQVKDRLEKLRTFARTKVTVIRNGGLAAVPDVDGLIGAVQAFPTSAAQGNVVPIFGMTSSYRSIANLPAGASGKLQDLDLAARDFAVLAEAQLETEQRIADLQYAAAHPLRFVMADYDMPKAGAAAKGALATTQDAVFKCSRMPSVCAQLRQQIPALPPLPELKAQPFTDVVAVVDAKGPLQCIKDVPEGVTASLTAAGLWRYSGGLTPWVGTEGYSRILEGQYVHLKRAGTLVVQIRDLADAERSIGIYSGAKMLIPPESRVCVAMNDDVNFYGDNENHPTQPMTVTIRKEP